MAVYSAVNGDDERHVGRPTSANSSRKSNRRHPSRGKNEAGSVGQASWISSVINLINTILGAGVLAMPLALSHMGILLGVVVIIWSGLTAGFGLYLQIRCVRYLERGSASFFALSQMTYPNAAVIFDAAIAIKCFGVGVSYLIIIGDLMPGVVRGFSEDAGGVGFLVDRHFWVTGFMLIVIPLSFLRRLDSLKYTSVVALISIGYLVILVVFHFFKGDTMQDRGPLRIIRWGGAVPTLSSFPVIVFAYTCHQNMFSILNEISNNSHFRTSGVVVASTGTSCLVYLLVAITGYLSFGNAVLGNIVGMYTPSVASTIGKAAIVVLVMFSYPLQVHPCRASVDAVLKWRPTKRSESPSASPSGVAPLLAGKSGHTARGDGMGETRFAAITTAIIVLSYVVAMTVSSLEKVLAYVGSTGSTSISFILPGLFYYKISSPDSPHHQKLMKEDDDELDELDGDEDEGLLSGRSLKRGNWQRNLLRRLSLALAIYGVVVMVTCLITNTFFIVGH
ncbi:amino acid transporter [Lasallia pustulata]|uniref:Amino acid transporter n=1 Tax=Lasallia pustulata TaxID=136370 RepID=A0A1W5CVC5_9LECA|nr:amino acid transporter [Lasallia pustulata]